ncbi:MAG: MMPL family transporter [Deltaproteobacteria bacterium]|nr:MMPL family transporter [Deltaproteobacteria bacterium]
MHALFLAIRFRWPVIAVCLGLTVLSIFGITRLQVEVDMIKYLPPDDPTVALFNRVGDKFKGNVLALVAVGTADVFSAPALKRVRELTEAFKLVDGVVSVNSLTDILDIREGPDGELEVSKLIDSKALPTDPDALRRLKEYTLSKEMYRGVMVSEDASVCLIMARLAQDADRLAVAGKLKEITLAGKGEEKYFYGGMPFQMITISEIMLRDMRRLIPLVSLVVLLTLLMGFRSARGVVLPLAVVLMACSWTMGLMGVLGIRLTMISNLTPVLLIAIGTAYAIHMIHRYGEELITVQSRREAARRAIRGVGLPIVMAGLTTAIGFISFFTSSLSMIREFGLCVAMGVVAALVLAVTFVPAVLSLLKRRVPRHMARSEESGVASRLTSRFFGLVLGHRGVVLALAAVVVGGAVAGIPRLTREVNMLEFFDPQEEIRLTEAMMKEKFGGSIPLQILVRGDVKDPAVLRELVRLEKFLRTLSIVRHPQSVADLVLELNDVMNGRRTIPPTREGVENLWLFIEGKDILEQLIDNDGQEALVQASLTEVNTKKLRDLTDSVERYLRQEMNLEIVSVDLSANLSEKVRGDSTRAMVETIVEAIERDLLFRSPGTRVDGEALRTILNRTISDRASPLIGADAGKLATLIHEYLTGPEADLDMKSAEKARVLAEAIAGRAVRGPLSLDSLEALFRSNVPPEALNEDPEGVQYAAEAIEARLAQAGKEARLASLRSRVEPLLPESALKNKDFQKELKSALWAANDDLVFLARQKLVVAGGGQNPVGPVVSFSVEQTGMPAIFSKIDDELVMSQVYSLLFAFGLVFLLLTLLFRSVKAGVLGTVPIAVTVAIGLGVMAYAGIALDSFLVMIAAVAVGIGIDYTIHVLARYKAELITGIEPAEAISRSLGSSGRAILLNAATVILGFLVFLGGSLVPLRNFGLLVALTMAISALAALTLLPVLVLVTRMKLKGNRTEKTEHPVTAKQKPILGNQE